MAAWNLAGAIEAMTPSDPALFVYKIARRGSDCAYLSAKSLESAKLVCGRNEVVMLNGAVVFDGQSKVKRARR